MEEKEEIKQEKQEDKPAIDAAHPKNKEDEQNLKEQNHVNEKEKELKKARK